MQSLAHRRLLIRALLRLQQMLADYESCGSNYWSSGMLPACYYSSDALDTQAPAHQRSSASLRVALFVGQVAWWGMDVTS